MKKEWKDPLNLLITGVGGQGNILISKLIGEVLLEDGYLMTIGETYGASQRGGSVASHVRISKRTQLGPIIPAARADIILGLEPVESLRMLCIYGNPQTCVISNTRPIHPMAVAIGESEYPQLKTIEQNLSDLSHEAWYLDASGIAIALGAPLLTNMVMAGALIGSGWVPLEEEAFEGRLKMTFQGEGLYSNLEAFRQGVANIRKQISMMRNQ